MGLSSLHADITERRCENRARIWDEYQYPQSPREHLQADRVIREVPTIDETIAAFEALHKAFEKNEPKYQRRLARETTFVFKYDAEQMVLIDGKYLSKGEAAKLTEVPWGHILDLETVFGGMLLRGSYLFIAEQRVMDAQLKYGSDLTLSALIDDIIKERMQA
jgi:hypothetical protein